VGDQPEAGNADLVEDASLEVVMVLEAVAHVHVRRRRPANEAFGVPGDDALDLREHVVGREQLAALLCSEIDRVGSDGCLR
jgi:hypothetical protein